MMCIVIPPYQPGQNGSLLWRQALLRARRENVREIRFSPGRYEFFPEGCVQRYCYFSNNDEGVKSIALALDGLDSFTVSGDNTELFFHGRISPLVAAHCSDLTVRDLTIDFEDSFVSDADVVRSEGDTAWIRIGGKHRFEAGRVRFSEDFFDNLSGRLEFHPYDAEKKELLWDERPLSLPNSGLREKDGLIGVPGLAGKFPVDTLVIKHELRLCPGIVLDQCRNVELDRITIHHAAGMGVLAQLCRDLKLEGVRVVPRGRRASVSDDAVHFSECRGKLSLYDCRLSGTLDDAFNAHGIYRPLKMRIPGGKFYYLDTGHFQQAGLPGAFPGDTLELLKNDTSRPYATVKVKAAQLINKNLTRIEVEGELPEVWRRGDNARVLDATPELTVIGCSFASLTGRGVLASGMKKVRISGNFFHTPGAGVFVSGDGNFWYESGPVEELLIEDNDFDNCCYRRFASSREAVAIFPELLKTEEDFFYHGHVVVRGNRFRSAPRPQISMLSVREAEVEGNIYAGDDAYPFDPPGTGAYSFARKDSPWILFSHCGTARVEGNLNFRQR